MISADGHDVVEPRDISFNMCV